MSTRHHLGSMCALGLLVCLTARAQDDGFIPFVEGKVLSVLDGDTIIVLDATVNRQHLVRLRGTDAPELAQAYGPQSRQQLASLLADKSVRVEFKSTDRYGRLIGRVLLDDEDVALTQLSAGLTWFYMNYTNELSTEDKRLYTQAEQAARAARRGLWQESAPVSPWDFRSSKGLTDEPVLEGEPARPVQSETAFLGNRRTKLYYSTACPHARRIPARLRVRFKSSAEAERAGYRAAPGCP